MYGRRYLYELGTALAAYAAVLVGSLMVLTHAHLQSGSHDLGTTLVAMTPMIPAAGACWAMLRQLRRIDEMQRRVQLEALAISFAGTAMITFSYGFLEGVGYPRMSMFVVWPIMAALWVIALFVCHRRYA
jgi:hypothetical protein